MIDTENYTGASFHQFVTYPKCGMSKVALKAVEPNEKIEDNIEKMSERMSGIDAMIEAHTAKLHN